MLLPYVPVQFTTSGTAADPAAVRAATEAATRAGEVLLIAHGWNNDLRQAQELFDELADNVAAKLSTRPAVIGILWPSVQWADADQIAGGGLAVAEPDTALRDRIAAAVSDPDACARLTALAGGLDDPAGRAAYVAELRGLLPPQDAVADDDAPPQPLRTGAVEELFEAVADAELAVTDDDAPVPVAAGELPPGVAPDLLGGSGAGAGLHLRDLNPARLAKLLLNTTTYYTMKARAGAVGEHGVAPLLNGLDGVRLHLAGHSFGARVMAMAAATTVAPVHSVSFLQGAFSHHGLAAADPAHDRVDGMFRPMLERGTLHGPVVVTHTANDKAVRLAYAIASRVARQAGTAIGDASDPYGGLGANGAVDTVEAVAGTLGGPDTTYAFAAGKVHNLGADQFVSGHGDVRNPAVANAVAQAMGG
jgi:hypothetical protein